MENKNSFFSLYIDTENIKLNDYQLEKRSNQIDLILSSMGVKSKSYKFKSKQNNELIYYFRTEDRKRKGQLDKYCRQYLPEGQEFEIEAMTRFVFDSEIKRLEENPNFKILEHPNRFEEYDANDIKIFDNPNNWHEWQKEIYDKIFETDGSFKKPDQRQIFSLVDKKGNSGKSSFFKYIYYKNQETVGRIGYGSASQLRSSSVNLGKKNLYIIDLARSKSKQDREEDLLSVVEDLKSGLVTNSMYGSGKTLLMEPPHVIISSNYKLKYELLSSDRWKVFEISKSKKLKEVEPKPETTGNRKKF